MDSFIYKNLKLNTIKLKKGTLLFRTIIGKYDHKKMKNVAGESHNILKDFYGKQELNKNYCLSPQHNVFFYLNPYMADTNLWFNHEYERNVIVYVLQQDIILLSFINSNYLISDQILKDKNILNKCNMFKLCNIYSGIKSDYCLSTEFIKDNPNIMGIYNVNLKDNEHLDDLLNTPKSKLLLDPFIEYFNFEKINTDLKGIAEISMYPFKQRQIKDIITPYNTNKNYIAKLYKNIYNNIDKYNYQMIEIFKHKPFDKNDELYKFIKNTIYNKTTKQFELRP